MTPSTASSPIDWARRAIADAGFNLALEQPDPRLENPAFETVRPKIDLALRAKATSLTASFELTLWRTDSTDSSMEVIDAFAKLGAQSAEPLCASGISGRWYKRISGAVGLSYEEQQRLIRRLDPEPMPS